MTAPGPFASEIDAIDAIGMRTWAPGEHGARNSVALFAACAEAGVELGMYDRRIFEWLAQFEPQAVAVIACAILRASA